MPMSLTKVIYGTNPKPMVLFFFATTFFVFFNPLASALLMDIRWWIYCHFIWDITTKKCLDLVHSATYDYFWAEFDLEVPLD